MKYKMTTIVTNQEAKTYRFKFSKGFLENLKEFTRIHKFDDPKIFKESFGIWQEENKETILRETYSVYIFFFLHCQIYKKA